MSDAQRILPSIRVCPVYETVDCRCSRDVTVVLNYQVLARVALLSMKLGYTHTCTPGPLLQMNAVLRTSVHSFILSSHIYPLLFATGTRPFRRPQ